MFVGDGRLVKDGDGTRGDCLQDLFGLRWICHIRYFLLIDYPSTRGKTLSSNLFSLLCNAALFRELDGSPPCS